jgi:hypothetical protein
MNYLPILGSRLTSNTQASTRILVTTLLQMTLQLVKQPIRSNRID